jgi:hypothetical protein
MNKMSKRVYLAIARTPRDYLIKVLAQRIKYSATQAGSYFPYHIAASAGELLSELLMAEWGSYEHPAVAQGTAAFRGPIPGYVGVMRLESLDPLLDPIISVINPKGLPHGQAAVRRTHTAYPAPLVDFSVAILGSGAELGEEGEILWTVHPGDPIRPTEIPLGSYKANLTVEEARALGVEWVKIQQ